MLKGGRLNNPSFHKHTSSTRPLAACYTFSMKMIARGFTLVEIIVVVSVLSILSAVIYANFNDSRTQSRDAQRQADLRALQNAIELYRQEYGRYPAGCNGAGAWSAQKGAGLPYECADGTGQYIKGYESGKPFTPEFIKVLPTDPKLNGAGSGYMYVTNTDGTSYKIITRNTVEVTSNQVDMHPSGGLHNEEFKVCDVSQVGAENVPCDEPWEANSCDRSVCDQEYTGFNFTDRQQFPNSHLCKKTRELFKKSYGVYGGWAKPSDVYSPWGADPNEAKYYVSIEKNTEPVWCKS